MGDHRHIQYRVEEGGVAVLLFDRPEAKNAFLPEMTDEAGEALAAAAADPAVARRFRRVRT